jgi:hypothetical protein
MRRDRRHREFLGGEDVVGRVDPAWILGQDDGPMAQVRVGCGYREGLGGEDVVSRFVGRSA